MSRTEFKEDPTMPQNHPDAPPSWLRDRSGCAGVVLGTLALWAAVLVILLSSCTHELVLPVGSCTFIVTPVQPLTLTYDEIVHCDNVHIELAD